MGVSVGSVTSLGGKCSTHVDEKCMQIEWIVWTGFIWLRIESIDRAL